jgi:predicted transcriptional regulator YdeE/DNA-binding transcriptional MerR regulator
MIKIGDFSKLAHVSIKTLHHYDELGLLKPAQVDRYNGYRYYALDQLPRINRILALKELGFALEQIAQLLAEDLPVAEMRGMLRIKQMELAAQVEAERARLARIELRLRQLEHAGQPPASEIAVKEVGGVTVLTAHAVAASELAIRPARQSLVELLQQNMTATRLKPAGPWFAMLSEGPYADRDLEVTMAVSVNPRSSQRAADWTGTPICFEELPSVATMASVIHQGDLTALPQTYSQLYGWAQSNGFRVAGSCREIYLTEASATNNLATTLETGFTEVQCPVELTPIPISIQSPTNQKEKFMEPKIVSKPAFKTVGLSYVGKNEQGEIPQMWGTFNQRAGEVEAINSDCCYGLCFSNVEGVTEGDFEYVAAIEVSAGAAIPKGMVLREVPAYKYAVFTHHGKLDTLGQTYEYIYNTGLAQAGLEVHPEKYDMEVYAERFIPNSDESEFDIYIAIK